MESSLDQGPRGNPFRKNRNSTPSRPQSHWSSDHRSPGIRAHGNPRDVAANARNNYERFTTMAKNAARRGDVIEAENFYQHAEHYLRLMREQVPLAVRHSAH